MADVYYFLIYLYESHFFYFHIQHASVLGII